MLGNLLIKLWKDESGVIATEYLMLSSIVALGSATGLAAMRDSITDEYKDFGQNMREARQSYLKPTTRTTSTPVNQPYTVGTTVPMPGQPNVPLFSPPTATQGMTPMFGAP